MKQSFYYRRRNWIETSKKQPKEDKAAKLKEIKEIMELNMVLYGKW